MELLQLDLLSPAHSAKSISLLASFSSMPAPDVRSPKVAAKQFLLILSNCGYYEQDTGFRFQVSGFRAGGKWRRAGALEDLAPPCAPSASLCGFSLDWELKQQRLSSTRNAVVP